MKNKLINPLKEFIADSRSVGIVLILATVLSLFLANFSFTQDYYHSFWTTTIYSTFFGFNFPHSLQMWINDFFMVAYFYLVSMEIKRELMIGELSSMKKASLPFFGALGGIIVPSLIFYGFNNGTPFAHGWGIPIATDIAFSLGVLSLLGKKAPLSLKILLMALAIIDDLGGIITIAFFYSQQIDFRFLRYALGVAFLMVSINYYKVSKMGIYFVLALLLWYFLFNSGIHATLAGVVLGLLTPLSKIEVYEHRFHDPINFIVMPLFALANTAIVFPTDILASFTSWLSIGIITGLVIGKPLGIISFMWLSIKLKIAHMPTSLTWLHILGMGLAGGIGFTISIFIASLALANHPMLNQAIFAVIIGSLISGLACYWCLSFVNNKKSSIDSSKKH